MSKGVRETSKAAYRSIMGSGDLSNRQKRVYRYLRKHGPTTGRELNQYMSSPDSHKRLPELRDVGLAIELGKRRNEKTNRRSIVWQATDGPIKAVPKKLTRAEKYEALCLKVASYLENQRRPSKRSDKSIARFIHKRIQKIETTHE